jgi:muramidase (phage lysozyme)
MAWQDDPVVNATAQQAPAFSDNTKRFLDFLAKAEGADYNVITGGSRFDDFSRHPGVVGMVTKQGPSTAAGRYQITKTTYNDVAPKLGITDFSPESQDRIAVELIRRSGALNDVEGGNFNAAIQKLGGTWASLPSSPYAGHPRRSAEWVNKAVMSLFPSAQAQGNPTSSQGAPMVATAKGGWMDDPVVEQPAPAKTKGGWMDDPVVGESNKATLPDITVPAKANTPAKPEKKTSFLQDVGIGAADALSFGFADEAYAKAMSALKGTKYEDELKTARETIDQAGPGKYVGMGASFLVPGVGVVRAANTAGRLGRAAAGAATGATQGALYGAGSADGDLADRAAGAATGAATGVVLGGALGSVIPSSVKQEGNAIIKKAGSEGAAKMDAEIIRDINQVAGGANQRGVAVGATQLNALENRYIGDVQNALKTIGKKDLEASGLKADDIAAAIRDRRIIGEDSLNALRGTTAGDALASAIEKAQRARSLTAAVPAATNPLARLGRAALDLAPIPQPVRYVGQRVLGSRQTREDVASKLVSDKQAEAAANVLSRLGPSDATTNLTSLQQMANQARAAQLAQAQARANARATAKAPKVENPNAMISEAQSKDPSYIIGLSNQLGAPRNQNQMDEFSKLIRQQMEARVAKENLAKQAQDATKAARDMQTRLSVLQETRRPLGGAFQELLPGGRANTNLPSREAIDALRLVKRQGGAVGEAADQVLKSRPVTNEDAFYGLQNALRGLQERGILSGSPQAAGAAASPVRNPISYAEAVRTAGEAANLARSSAPSKELAQFATKVAGTKAPADKVKLLQDRLGKTTDPAEISYLTNFIEPLTRFGAK